MRIGFIGAGNISKYHIEAAIEAGFKLTAICGQQNSITAPKVGLKYGFKNICNNVEDLLKLDLDCIAIITPTRIALEIYRAALKTKLPILIEKPVAPIPELLAGEIDLNRENTLVGYNRRFYGSIQKLKNFLNNVNKTQSHWNIPEMSWAPVQTEQERNYFLMENSVHCFDLINYLLGVPVNIQSVKQNNRDGVNSTSSVLEFLNGSIATVTFNFGIPANTSIDIYSDGKNICVKPLEILTTYDSILGIPASKEIPYKRYKLISSQEWTLPKEDVFFKPGFVQQYKEFYSVVNGKKMKVGANLQDAKNALDLAAKIGGR